MAGSDNREIGHEGYLSPEPMLQEPRYVRTMGMQGLSVPTYAYALNNPLRYVDSNGLYFRRVNSRAWSDLLWLLNDPLLGPDIRRMAEDPINAFDVFRVREKRIDEVTKENGGGRCSTDPRAPSIHQVVYSPEFYSRQFPLGVSGRPLTPTQLLAHELGEAWSQWA